MTEDARATEAAGKTFLLGVGAQKAGTTWLYDYLNDHPQTDMGLYKEYHLFDNLHVPSPTPRPRQDNWRLPPDAP